MTTQTADPVSIEIHRKALENITTEMAIALTRTSGSPVVYEVQDFATCLLDTAGDPLAMSATVLFHAGSSMLGTLAIIEALDGVTPQEGEGWIVNDSFTGGAQHQADVAIIMPTFYEGDHVGWAFTNVHVLDVGGVGISGFAPGAKTVFDEGVRFPATKVMRDGELDSEWERYLRANVRIADLVINDLRAMIAANNVAQRKLVELIDRFGLEDYTEFCEINKTLTEEAFRARIGRLPDGVYETSEWLEYDGQNKAELMELRCRMQIDGDEMKFSFTGSPQTSGFVNGAKGVVYGAVMVSILTSLGYGDMPFNAGLWRPIEIDLGEPGSIVNAQPPAPVTSGHAACGVRVSRAVKELLGQACGLSEDPVLRSRVAAQAHDSIVLNPLEGIGHGGLPTVVFFMDLTTGHGGGAQSIFDGQDSYGLTCTPGVGLPNIETNEAQQPALYLWRRLVPQSGGPGTFRGGQAIDLAYSVYETDVLEGAICCGCAETPAHGAAGGLVGAGAGWNAYYKTNLAQLLEEGRQPLESALEGDAPVQKSNEGRLELQENEVIRMRGGGGGGLGDPLLREPEVVAKDIRDGYVTADHARTVYGVVLDDDGELDAETSAGLRAALRRERIGSDPTAEAGAPADAGVSVVLHEDGEHWGCGYCGDALTATSENWRGAAVSRERPLADAFEELDMIVRDRLEEPRVMLAERFCPSCAGLLTADLFPEGFAGYPVPRLGTPEVEPLGVPA
ncbi:MAG TPA: hydantoinase B/oxoprolinase family protein [Solirubrobacterales bacterium]|nr:hydantoinase B/oxoprolinase family protein [Solirubrobacterales bacterium]